ncbi:polymerase catalytic subunit VP55 [Eastern grey kangaroopox virus]|uniref:Poly(A) polymerase catalytic subunit n=1 Tax=Eastern grey kangaroopox virus TaxID=2042482 RepID=A0A2C9DT05_9POXV|nr:polymerase catalytic subunit VP55 [Eastern grey kangaroopox virus]ATI21138.1 polymerase catalytic subunit VP55 [Eastern grey kangaroopox virus]ATX75039.1 poly(A) polymerase catalytic subunit [Eastern grey kangaroopox virus]
MNDADRRSLDVISTYLGKAPTVEQYHVLRRQVGNISKVLKFDKDIFFSLIKKNKQKFFGRAGKDAEIRERVLEYFDKQKTVDKLRGILTILEFQKIIVSSYTKILGVLTTRSPVFYHSVVRLNYSSMDKLAEEVLWSYNVACDSGKVMGRHNVSELVSHVNRLMEEYMRRHSGTCVCYGSYSLHLLNNNIEYGDIDLLQTNARLFLIDLAFLIRFVTGRFVILLKVPYLKNYIVMQDENQHHVIDSFNISTGTMNRIPKIMVDNVYIIDPCVQLMNFLKMLSQIDRLEELQVRLSRLASRLGTLLEYTRYRYSVSFAEARTLKVSMRIDLVERIVLVDTRGYELGYEECLCYLDEEKMLSVTGKMPGDRYDFEAVSNSAFLVSNGIMYTYFSNTVLLASESDIHEVSFRAICAHVTLFHVLVGTGYEQILPDLLGSLVIADRRPIIAVVPRDKKSGKHHVIDIARDIIMH